MSSSTAAQQEFAKVVNVVWQNLGKEDPYWGVMTHPAYKSDVITDAEIEKFYQTGDLAVETIRERIASYMGETTLSSKTFMDYGSGCGRVILGASKLFKTCLAVDVSTDQLKLLETRSSALNVTNVKTLCVDMEQIDSMRLPETDIIHSLMVLQHNPPSLCEKVIDLLLSALAPNGIAMLHILFHMPCYNPDSNFTHTKHFQLHPFGSNALNRLRMKHKCEQIDCFPANSCGEGYVDVYWVVRKTPQ